MSPNASAAWAESPVAVQRLPVRLARDERRVIALPFAMGDKRRVADVIERITRMPDDEVTGLLAATMGGFAARHQRLTEDFEERYNIAARVARRANNLPIERRLLIGAYFTMEYSIEAAALFNPSIVAHPDQAGAPENGLRFVLSLRAVGEGHVSSIVFQTGLIHNALNVTMDPAGPFATRARPAADQEYLKELFHRKLVEMGVNAHVAERLMGPLPDRFTFSELGAAIGDADKSGLRPLDRRRGVKNALWLARSNYELQLPDDAPISDLLLFPRGDSESRGMEDLRLVRFVDDDETVTFYGTYTAFDGERILPMLLDTKDFRRIAIHTLNGACVQNKGMALFPRRIDGHYVMCSRIDGRNLFIMLSDYVHFWETAELLAAPKYPWEFQLMGNCGSPLETPEGWLLLTHGVGPMRRYCIGAMLLDRQDPFRIIGRLRQPLLSPAAEEREGYVPNVVYSCGSIIHRGRLYLPYATSDTATSMATVALDELLDRLRSDGP